MPILLFLLALFLISLILGILFKAASLIFKIYFWLLIKLPIALVLGALGLLLCLTVVLGDAGRGCLKAAGGLLKL